MRKALSHPARLAFLSSFHPFIDPFDGSSFAMLRAKRVYEVDRLAVANSDCKYNLTAYGRKYRVNASFRVTVKDWRHGFRRLKCQSL